MASEIVMRCQHCGAKYRPNVTGPAPTKCYGCGNPILLIGEVVFGDFPDGSKYAAEFADVDERLTPSEDDS